MRRSTPLSRSRGLRSVGARKEREAEELEAFRANPPAHCDRCGRRRRVDPHHIKPRSRGGTHSAANRAWLCFDCHRGVHDHTLADWRAWIE